MLTVVFMKWFDPNGRYNSLYTYSAEHVNRARRMVDRHLSLPHRFVLATDDATGVDADIKIVPLLPGLAKLGHRWQKLSLFAPGAKARYGQRVLYLDLDLVILSDITPLITDHDFRIAKAITRRMPYNSGMMLLTIGSRADVWSRFRMRDAEDLVAESGIDVSDQYWIFKALGPDEAVWSAEDGVVQYQSREDAAAPGDARIVFLTGYADPSLPRIQESHPWVIDHWR